MPTVNIIGYLWSKRQELDLDGLPDVLQMVSDLQRYGLECARVTDIIVLGQPIATPSVELVLRDPLDWATLVEDAIIQSSISHALLMIHEDGDVA